MVAARTRIDLSLSILLTPFGSVIKLILFYGHVRVNEVFSIICGLKISSKGRSGLKNSLFRMTITENVKFCKEFTFTQVKLSNYNH